LGFVNWGLDTVFWGFGDWILGIGFWGLEN